MSEVRNIKAVDQQPEKLTAEEVGVKLRSGTIALANPILARDKEITELKYDFDKVTGWEYLDAMDVDKENTNMFRISQKQAFALFVKAAAKVNADVDETDLRTRMGTGDIMNAVRLATFFFVTTSRAAGKRINKE